MSGLQKCACKSSLISSHSKIQPEGMKRRHERPGQCVVPTRTEGEPMCRDKPCLSHSIKKVKRQVGSQHWSAQEMILQHMPELHQTTYCQHNVTLTHFKYTLPSRGQEEGTIWRELCEENTGNIQKDWLHRCKQVPFDSRHNNTTPLQRGNKSRANKTVCD